ncbi:putative reverse transcriptase domain-containing protein [Helianthus annuus]|nr:putative reverse transcriptase domain-containing protein [Helianthus annuus]
MDFPQSWRTWISSILAITTAYVLINGSPAREFQCFCGLLQGDSLSPFLFILVMSVLSCVVKQACSVGGFHGIRLSGEEWTLSR